nr:MAG TPA: YopX protein [Caudoviricetes sp.]
MIPKFRVWLPDPEVERMLRVKALVFENDKTRCVCGYAYDFYLEDEDAIIMQSTGLRDKNGKEIFEGDIIQTSAYGCIVSFGEYTYFEDEDTQTTEVGFYLSFLNVTPATYAPFEKFYWDNCEVIGNIYENELDLIMYELHKYNKTARDEVE